MHQANALLLTRDELLLDDLLRLSAAAEATLDVAHDVPAGLRGWGSAPVVLVGGDLAGGVAEHRPPQREQVYVVARAPLGDGLFRAALALGARNVVELPVADEWLVEVLTDVVDGGARRAVTVGVVGGSGGVGATTFASALALVAARNVPTLLLDLDPVGPGVDRVVGFDELPGVRWESLLETPGRLGARSLREAVPHQHGLGVLTWSGSADTVVDSAALGDVLSAGQRGHGLVVLDVPRHAVGQGDQALPYCDHVVLVSALQLPAVACTAKVAQRLRQSTRDLRLLTRTGRGASLEADDVAAMLEIPLLCSVGDQRRLSEDIDLGVGPVRSSRGPLAKAARRALSQLAVVGEAAA